MESGSKSKILLVDDQIAVTDSIVRRLKNQFSFLTASSGMEAVEKLKSENDFVIIYFHGGAEGSSASRVTKNNEYFLGENRGNVYKFSHSAIDFGADLVIGSGPHIPRGLELYKNKLIVYSLGNFCTYGKFSLSGALGYAPIIKIFIDKKGNFVSAQIFSAIQIKRGIPVIDSKNIVYNFIKNLTYKDFSDCGLSFEDDEQIIFPD